MHKVQSFEMCAPTHPSRLLAHLNLLHHRLTIHRCQWWMHRFDEAAAAVIELCVRGGVPSFIRAKIAFFPFWYKGSWRMYSADVDHLSHSSWEVEGTEEDVELVSSLVSCCTHHPWYSRSLSLTRCPPPFCAGPFLDFLGAVVR